MLIRKYKKEDLEDINKLGSLLHLNYEFKLDEFSHAFIIKEDDNFIGFIVYSIIYERAEIIDIIIKPCYRKCGYASKLFSYTLDVIKSKNVDNVTLEVNEENTAAINLYEKFGFKICGVRKKYYNDKDGYLMKKDLR